MSEDSAPIVWEPEAWLEARAPQTKRPKMPGHVRNDDAINLGVTSNDQEYPWRSGTKEGFRNHDYRNHEARSHAGRNAVDPKLVRYTP